MWNLTRHFTLGYLTGGVVVSFVACFLVRSGNYAFWQLCLGYMFTACLTGVMFGGTAKVIGYPQGSATNGRFALRSGLCCVFLEFAIATATHSFEVGRALLFVLPIAAAVVYVIFARRDWRRRVLTGVQADAIPTVSTD